MSIDRGASLTRSGDKKQNCKDQNGGVHCSGRLYGEMGQQRDANSTVAKECTEVQGWT